MRTSIDNSKLTSSLNKKKSILMLGIPIIWHYSTVLPTFYFESLSPFASTFSTADFESCLFDKNVLYVLRVHDIHSWRWLPGEAI